MKKKLLQLCLSVTLLVFFAAIAHAYTPPVSAPGGGNTDAPLNEGSIDQAKAGGLTVGTFQARNDSLFNQNVFFDGFVRGGTPNASAPVAFGGPVNKVDTLFTGGVAIDGVYQSNTLKNNASAPMPICANQNGVVYLCGQPPAGSTGPTQGITLEAAYATFSGGTFVVANISPSADVNIVADVVASAPNGGTGLLPNAKPSTCQLPADLGNVTVYAGSISSYNPPLLGGTLSLPAGCDPAAVVLNIKSYSPHTTPEGVPITGY